MRHHSGPLLLLAAACLTGCAGQGNFPSLAPRAVERGLAGGMAPAGCPDDEIAAGPALPAAPAAIASDARLRTQVSELLAQARAGQSAFAAALPEAEASAANSGAAGSEAWISAQQNTSRLQAARSQTAYALAELDSISIGRMSTGAVTYEDRQAVLAAEQEVRAMADLQQEQLDRVSRQLEPS